MRCFKCSTDNSEGRKYCRECGSLIVIFCRKCGYHNSLSDKYCGGCGDNLLEMKAYQSEKSDGAEISACTGKRYSDDDIRELIDRGSQEKEKQPKKKDMKEADEVSQDLIDDLFGSEKSEAKDEKP